MRMASVYLGEISTLVTMFIYGVYIYSLTLSIVTAMFKVYKFSRKLFGRIQVLTLFTVVNSIYSRTNIRSLLYLISTFELSNITFLEGVTLPYLLTIVAVIWLFHILYLFKNSAHRYNSKHSNIQETGNP